MIYMRGQAADYDHWRQLDLPGWGWSDVLPFFMRQEDHFANRNLMALEGNGAPICPESAGTFLTHLPKPQRNVEYLTDDFNGGDNFGCGYFHVNQRNGRRLSAATAFLKPVAKRPNLSIISGARADKIIFQDRRARAVRVLRDQTEICISARNEIILCAGAVATPPLLERSEFWRWRKLRRM